jgi:hypothetical protein
MSARGPATGYIDIDQLGMSYVDEDEDPERHRLKGRALSAVASEFARTGVGTLVVSGVAGLELTDFYAGELAHYDPVFVRLTAPYGELRRRLSTRGVYAEEWAGVEECARSLDASKVDHLVVESGPGAPADVAARVLEAVGGLVDDARESRRAVPSAVGDGGGGGGDRRAILIGGTTAVGKSTIGWRAFMATRQQGRASAFVDLRQLGFVGVDGGDIDHHLQAGAARALWHVFKAHGAQVLILNGPINSTAEMITYRAALADTQFDAVRLTAERSALLARVRARMRGEMPPLAGDSLVGRPAEEAEAIADGALRLQNSVGGGVALRALDTTGLDPAEAAQRILSGRG